MSTFKFALLGLLHLLTSSALGSKCPQDDVSNLVVCYYEGKTSLGEANLCNCTHVVFANAVKVTNISMTEDAVKNLETVKQTKKDLPAIFTLEGKEDDTARILKSENRSLELVNDIYDFLLESHFDGVEINFRFWADDGVSKESFAFFLKSLSKALSSGHRRTKREGYDVFEKLDDITTAAYTTQTPKNSTTKTQSIKQRKRKDIDGDVGQETLEDPDDADYLTLEEAGAAEKQNTLKDIEEDIVEDKKILLFVRLPLQLELIAKKYDLKALSRYADILVVPTHNITSSNEHRLTYHPSRLMGLTDILNTDSILDFLTGMGGLKSKMVISMPATVLKFELKDENENTPRAPSRSQPQVINQSQLCALFSKSNWTVERDEDLTAPYAFSGKTWLAFEDEISVDIKGKYILLRELAGGGIYPIDADVGNGVCGKGSGLLTGALHGSFERLGRKPRALVLESLEEEIHQVAYTGAEAGVKVSEYRIVRVVDHTGAVHVIRKNTKTQFECSRQGYFSHPLGCNKFYRCVKFDQYSDEFTVFEYDCPAGLAFDERWEVCVWPGSLPHGAPCTGSSEIAPVPRSHYRCPNQEGYFADPENCRWFFACLDHARDGITPLTAYEFRCPFGLVFSEEKLACDWPWLVGSCGNAGAAGFLRSYAGGQSQGIHTTTFINGGNLEASLGQFGNAEAASFINFDSEFGSVLKGAKYNSGGSYRSGQSPGLGYIRAQYNDDHNRASFASFPDYEVSGGRIFNKGGVVLGENIAGVSGAAAGAGAAAGGVGVNIEGGAGSSVTAFDKGTGYLNGKFQSGGGFYGGAAITGRQLNLTPEIIKTNVLKTSGQIFAAHGQVQSPISTPKPFSVSIPSVQINSEYSGPSTAGPTTAQNILYTATSPETEIVSFHQEQQHSTSQGFVSSQPSDSVNPSFVTPPTGHGFGDVLSGSSPVSPSEVSFLKTPKAETHRFGGFKQSEFLDKVQSNPAAISTAGAAVTVGTQSFGYSLGGQTASKPVSVSVPTTVTKKLEYSSTGQVSGFYNPVAPTETPFAGFVIQDQAIAHRGLGKAPAFSQIPQVQTHSFKSAETEQGLVSVNAVSKGATVTPQVYSSEGDTGLRLSFASSKPALTTPRPSIDEKVSNELYLNTPVTPAAELFSKTAPVPVTVTGNAVSSKISVVTPKPDFRFSQTGLNSFGVSSTRKASFGFPAVTQQTGLNFYEGRGSVDGGTAGVSVGFPELRINGFGQTGSAGVLKEFPKATVGSTGVTGGIRAFEQKETVSEKTSYGVPILEKTDGVVPAGVSRGFLEPTVFQAPQQRYSFQHFSNNFGSGGIGSTPGPTSFKVVSPLPKVQQTEISIQQQHVPSVGTVGADLTVSTPQPTIAHIDFKSNYNQQESVATPAPAVSVLPPAPSTYKPPQQFVSVFAKSPDVAIIKQQQRPESIDTSRTLVNLPDVTFDEKSSNLFKQEFKSFTPVATEKGFASDVGSHIYVDSGLNSPPVSPKVEIFGASVQQSFQPPTKQVQFTQQHVTTVAPDYEKRVQSEGPIVSSRERLVDLEITKSIELNPSQFFQSTGGYSQEDLAKSIEIQQQPLQLIPHKTIPTKQVIQPFFKQQQKEVGGIGQDDQFSFHRLMNVKTQKTEFGAQNQYLVPSVTAKPHLPTPTHSAITTVDFAEGVTYSKEDDGLIPALPVFEASKVPVTTQKEISATGYLAPAVIAGQKQISPSANVVLTNSAPVPQFPPASIYDFQKVNKNIGTAGYSFFPQAETHFNVLDTSGRLFQYNGVQNLTRGSVFETRNKYAINPNIAIPEPPKEYVLVQNQVTTAAPEFSTTSSWLKSTTEGRESTYLKPALTSSRKPTKTTLISVGSLDEDEIRDGRMQQLFDKYSGRFGDVVGGRNGKIVTKLVKGNANGEIAIGERGASSVRYEISSTGRPSGQERKYHGGITSGVKATNKYEEYDIGGVGSGQRNLDGAEDAKTTLDLKNLKLEKNKKTVIVVSQVSDANPILVGKLAGQCSCQSNMLEIRNKGRKSDQQNNKNSPLSISNKYLPPYETAAAVDTPRQGAASTASPETVVIDGSKSSKLEVATEQHYVSSSTTVHPNLISSTILSSLGPDGVLSITPKTVYSENKPRKKQFRGRTRYLPPSSALQENGLLSTGVTASEIAGAFDYSGDESRSQNEVEGGRNFALGAKVPGAAFDRYGPGGWRGFDEVLQGSVDCKRPGLFRHPKYCNKFYACNYDPWKERYTLHVFNCPIQLTYDSSISACNWPVRGPACADDNLLV